MLKYLSLVIILLFATSFSNKITYVSLEKVQATVESKQLEKGKSIILKSQIFYQLNGDCVTHFTSPVEYFVTTNKLGEVKVYDPIQNTVLVQQDNLYSSKQTPFYFFLSGKSNDMGLKELGFSPGKTYAEKNNLVSEWKIIKPNKI